MPLVHRCEQGLGVTVGAIIVAALAGCSGGSNSASDTVPLLVDRPLSIYPDGGAEWAATVQNARAQLVFECMRDRGFDDIPPPNRVLPTDPSILGRPFGIETMEEAESKGYGGNLSEVQESPMDVYLTNLERTDPDRLALVGIALYGTQSDPGKPVKVTLPGGGAQDVFPIDQQGCSGIARRGVEGQELEKFVAVRRQVELVGNSASERATADPRVIAAQQAWSKCMAASGYAFDTPAAASNAGVGLTIADRASGIRMAKVDVACKESSHLVASFRAVRNGYEQQLLDQQLGLVELWRQLSDSALDRALEILA